MSNRVFITITKKQVVKGIAEKLVSDVDGILNAHAENIATAAKQLVADNSFDRGTLAQHISANNKIFLEKHIVANTPYAPYVEFGTGKYAAEYVSTLPDDWQSFAGKFRGGTEKRGLYKAILEWVKRKGIVATYSVKTQRRRKSNASEEQRAKQVAYLFYRSIFEKGTHPHPYLFPAYEQELPLILKDIENLINSL